MKSKKEDGKMKSKKEDGFQETNENKDNSRT